jgi:hypothetical protein
MSTKGSNRIFDSAACMFPVDEEATAGVDFEGGVDLP